MTNIATSQSMNFSNLRPVVGDYIEFTKTTQQQYNISWYCSDVIRVTDDGGFYVRYDGGSRILYIDDFEPMYLSASYNKKIYRVKPK